MEKSKIQVGGIYKTKGGWNAFIYTQINGKPQGWCKDSFGNEELSMGTWDEDTGKCLKRGDSTNIMNTEPYDIISFENVSYPCT
jgi:hypothetical protein